MTLNIGDVIRVAMTGQSAGTNVFQNVWHYIMTSGAGATEAAFLQALELQLTDAITHIESNVSDEWSWESVEAWLRDPVLHQWDGIGEESMVGLVGVSASDVLPHGNAMVCRYITESARRQGRHFIPGWIAGLTSDGIFEAAALADAALYMDDFTDDLTPTGGVFELCTYNVDPESALYESESVFNDTVFLNDIVGYQRRRKPLVGI